MQLMMISIPGTWQVWRQTSGFGSGKRRADTHTLLQEDVHGSPVSHYAQLSCNTIRHDTVRYYIILMAQSENHIGNQKERERTKKREGERESKEVIDDSGE